MKFTLPLVALSLGATAVSAFPAMAGADINDLLKRDARLQDVINKATSRDYSAFRERSESIKKGGPVNPKSSRSKRAINAVIDPSNFKFDAKAQHVDLTSSEHRYIAPGPNDIRGPCPGLNLLSNHGYLDRSGVTNLFQGIDAINRVFGVGYDLALALNAYAVVFNGDVVDLTWSIGGPYHSKGLGSVVEIVTGTPRGISAHNIYEGDASIVRQDYYAPEANHDNVHLHMPFFQELLDQGKAAAGDEYNKPEADIFTPTVMLQHKAARWHYSVKTNPLFFNSAFGGAVVTTAAERFVAEFAANNTADSEGYNRIYLDEPNLFAFFGVTRSKNGKLVYHPGQERLLPSWVRRPINADFGLDDIALTLLNAAAIDPSLISVGGNVGKVDTFTGVNAGDISGGLFNTAGLLKDPQGLSCFLYQAGIEELIPTQLNVLYTVLGDVLDFVGKTLGATFRNIATTGNNPCDSFNDREGVKKAYKKFPGSSFVLNGTSPTQ